MWLFSKKKQTKKKKLKSHIPEAKKASAGGEVKKGNLTAKMLKTEKLHCG